MKKIQMLAAYVLPSIVVLGIMAVFFAAYGIYPFGEKTVSWCDMNQQVVPLLLDFKEILQGESGFFLKREITL